MNRKSAARIFAILLSILLISGCGRKEQYQPAPTPPEPTPTAAAPSQTTTAETLWGSLEGVWVSDVDNTWVCFGDPATNNGWQFMVAILMETDAPALPMQVIGVEELPGNRWSLEVEQGFLHGFRELYLEGDLLRIDAWEIGETADFHKQESPERNFADDCVELCGYGQYMVFAEDGLRLRSGPGVEYEKLAVIPAGTVIYEYGLVSIEEGGSRWCAEETYGDRALGEDWIFTVFDGRPGWVSREYLLFHRDV